MTDDLAFFCPTRLRQNNVDLTNYASCFFVFFKMQSWVGIMLVYQPFLVGGFEDVEKAKNSAFGAACTFFFTFMVSVIYLISDSYFHFSFDAASLSLRNNNNNNPRAPGNRGEYDLVSLVNDYHPDDDVDEELDEEHEMGVFS